MLSASVVGAGVQLGLVVTSVSNEHGNAYEFKRSDGVPNASAIGHQTLLMNVCSATSIG